MPHDYYDAHASSMSFTCADVLAASEIDVDDAGHFCGCAPIPIKDPSWIFSEVPKTVDTGDQPSSLYRWILICDGSSMR